MKARRQIILIVIFFVFQFAKAVNPLFTTCYTADPAARVIGDRVYVFCSEDPPDKTGPTIIQHRLYSSDDLVNWTDHGPVVKLQDVKWANTYIWAPDWIMKNNKFYYFAPGVFQKELPCRIGVLKSSTITGPYTGSDHYMKLDEENAGDPCVFTDDDGASYLYWGIKGLAKGGKLKESMEEVESVQILQKAPKFMEGVYVFKRKGIYYLTYVSTKPSKDVQYLYYSTSQSPLGPFEYQGPYAQMAQGANNIHQSHIEFKGQWYTFYHDTSMAFDGSPIKRRRSVRLDKMEFDEKGGIRPLVWTSDGPPAVKNLDPYQPMLAVTGRPENPQQTEWMKEESEEFGYLHVKSSGTTLTYFNCDFGTYWGDQKTKATIKIKPLQKGTLYLHLDHLIAPPIAQIELLPEKEWQVIPVEVFRAAGVRKLMMHFVAEDPQKPLCDFQGITFARPQK